MLEKRSKQGLLKSENKIGGNVAFSEIIKLQSEIKCHALLYISTLFMIIVA